MSNGFYLSEHKNLIINQERSDIYLKNQISHRWYAKCGVRKRGQGMEKSWVRPAFFCSDLK